MQLSHEEVTWWMQVAGWIAGLFTSFVGGIVAATVWMTNKFNDLQTTVATIKERTDELPDSCPREQISMEINSAVQAAILELQITWGVEIAGAKEQRLAHAQMLAEIGRALVRLHERIDDILLDGKLPGRVERRDHKEE